MTYLIVMLSFVIPMFLFYFIFGKTLGRSLYFSYLIYANFAYNMLHFSGISLTFIGLDLMMILILIDSYVFENTLLRKVFVTDEELEGEEDENNE